MILLALKKKTLSAPKIIWLSSRGKEKKLCRIDDYLFPLLVDVFVKFTTTMKQMCVQKVEPPVTSYKPDVFEGHDSPVFSLKRKGIVRPILAKFWSSPESLQYEEINPEL